MNSNGRGNVGVIVGAAVLVGALAVGAMFITGKTTSVRVMTAPTKSASAKPAVTFEDKYKGFELVPGVYKMAWTIKSPSQEPPYYSMDRITADQRDALMGRVSLRTYCCDYNGNAIVLAESGGKYETAYVFLDTTLTKGVKVSLDKALRVTLKQNGDMQTSERLPVNRKFGDRSHSVTKQGDVQLKVRRRSANDFSAHLIMRGAWQAMLPTSNGVMAMELQDTNRDGRFGHDTPPSYLCPSCGKYHSYGADQLHISGIESSCYTNGYYSEGYCSVPGVEIVAGKLYRFEASATGDTVEIKKYTGKTGTLQITARDGRGKPAGFSMSIGADGDSFAVSGVGSRNVQVPPGTYSIRMMLGAPEPPGVNSTNAENPRVDLTAPDVNVVAGGSVKLNLGGPIRFVITPADKPIVAKYGSQKMVAVYARAGESSVDLSSGPSGRVVPVRVYDSAGALVMKKDVDLWNTNVGRLTEFDAGQFGVGDYTVKVAYNFKPYSGKATATARIHVEK